VTSRNHNWTAGKIFLSVIQRERRGDTWGHGAGDSAHTNTITLHPRPDGVTS
jgi:CTP synthase (UTP-ammonia lyase)